MNSKSINTFLLRSINLGCFAAIALLSACEPDDPGKEDVPELITKVTLQFTPLGGAPVVVTATDPDGAGVQPLEPDGPITLFPNTTYVLTMALVNSLATSGTPEYDISAEVAEEGDEHMFFFSWTNSVFSDPTGNGNIDSRADAVNYEDEDADGLPLGLITSWTSKDVEGSGKFRIVLKHQPELKTETSEFTVGDTDLDIEFDIDVTP